MNLQNHIPTEAIQLLRSLIATPSFSGEEQATAKLIHSFLLARGLSPIRQQNNVWVRNTHFDPDKKTILLCSHHDTVKPSLAYTHNPFVPMERDGKLYGLGSNDAGAALVSLTAAFMFFSEQKNLRYNLLLAAVAEEEVSGPNGISSILPEIGAIDFAIVGEPTQMQMAIAEKGLLVIDCEIKGKSGHAARDEGDNAILKAMRDIEWLGSYQFKKNSPLLGPVKMSVTMIQSGTQHNVIPERCTFTVDIRVNEQYTHEEILEIIQSNIVATVTARSTRLRSTEIAKTHPIVQAGLKQNLSIFGSSTLSDKALMPFPALKIGPGDSARSHTADEFIYLSELEEGIDTYIQLLKELL